VFSPLLDAAAELAAEWHDGTYRKGRWRAPVFSLDGDAPVRTPMMAHLTTVALLVMRAGFDDETVAAALLHDSIEDENRAGARLRTEVLREAVGERVTNLVLDVSEPKQDAAGRSLPWQARKDAYIAHLRTAPVEAAAVSLADKLHNLWTVNETLAATEHHTDARLDALRADVRAQLARFERLTGLNFED